MPTDPMQFIDYRLTPIDNFSLGEMKCRCGCGLVIFQPELMEKLNLLRIEYGATIVVNSWTRCKAHNKAVGGKRNSLHRWGKAVDIRPFRAMRQRDRFDRLCVKHFPFVKPYPDFMHCDIRGHRGL